MNILDSTYPAYRWLPFNIILCLLIIGIILEFTVLAVWLEEVEKKKLLLVVTMANLLSFIVGFLIALALLIY